MYLSTGNAWLQVIQKLSTGKIDLSLERIAKVAKRLSLQDALLPPVITVAGTNGKGSTVSALEAIYRKAGYRTGLFTSPFLRVPNEQVKIDGENVADRALCEAFAAIDVLRSDIALTPFEFFTLAAFWLFRREALDVWILEVGLGGRLDAVNVLDADIGVITSIDLDHEAYLGATRELISLEKAGILRKARPCVYGDLTPTQSLIVYCERNLVPLNRLGKEFQYQEEENTWSWQGGGQQYDQLPYNSLYVQNMASVLMTVTLMQKKLPVAEHALKAGLRAVKLPGRIEIIPGSITQILDVAHNPAGIRLLARTLQSRVCTGRIIAVFSMLADKDLLQSVRIMQNLVAIWFVGTLCDARAASAAQLRKAFALSPVADEKINYYNNMQQAYAAAEAAAVSGDVIVVFGSFHTVREVLNLRT